MRCSISITSEIFTPKSSAISCASLGDKAFKLWRMLRKLKNSLRCGLVVATRTKRQLRKINS